MADIADQTKQCHRCGELLIPHRIVWMELNYATGRWHRRAGEVPPEHSHGWFPFGNRCARNQLQENRQVG